VSGCLSTWLDGEAGAPFGDGAMRDPEQVQPVTYSVIPSKPGGVHAVYDFVIRAAFYDAGRLGLRAVCGAEVHPDSQLPPLEAVCADCGAALPHNAVPRPAPGSPILCDLARIHAEMAR
jgi:hypothetical protein